MKCKYHLALVILSSLAMLGLATSVSAQSVLFDFDAELPGVQAFPAPGGFSFFGGDDLGGTGASPTVVEEITELGGEGGSQSFQISIDSTANEGSYFYYGLGGFFGFYGEDFGFAEGQAGEDDPANFVFSFDIKIEGNDGEEAMTPWGGNFTVFKSDYEAVNGVDLNGDMDMEDGYDIWSSDFTAEVVDNNYTHIEWRLNSGTTPTAPSAEITTPVFDDEASLVFRMFGNSGGFGTDANNVISIDNVQLLFDPLAPVEGDFDGDRDVDGADYLQWQLGNSPTSLSAEDLAEWQLNHGFAEGLSASISSVPEPSSVVLLLSAGAFFWSRRR